MKDPDPDPQQNGKDLMQWNNLFKDECINIRTLYFQHDLHMK